MSASFASSDGWILKARQLNPAMRVGRRRQKKHKNEQRHDQRQHRKDDRRARVEVIVHLHDDEHHRQSQHGGDQLFECEIIRVSEFLLRHDRRRTEHHRNTKTHESQRDEEEESIWC